MQLQQDYEKRLEAYEAKKKLINASAQQIRNSIYEAWHEFIYDKFLEKKDATDEDLNKLLDYAMEQTSYGSKHPLSIASIYPIMVATINNNVYALFQYGDTPANIGCEILVLYEPTHKEDYGDIGTWRRPLYCFKEEHTHDGLMFQYLINKIKQVK